ncbi:MAG TPA: hypothetical protein VMW23_06740 [Sedimentisphaerales bacterium]|nr:hypothetical protein [Sedimentisphaerales bacterium]
MRKLAFLFVSLIVAGGCSRVCRQPAKPQYPNNRTSGYAADSQTAGQVSRFGITWTFDRQYPVGQFVNGDWWVIGPVTIVSVEPAPGPAPPDEQRKDYINQFGDSCLQDDKSMRNGSMVVTKWGRYQGYDSGAKTYRHSESIGFPYRLDTNRSLISTISHGSNLKNPKILPFRREVSMSLLKTAAVLTCLAEKPPGDAFRPPYVGTWKPVYRAGNLKREILPNLPAVADTPTFAEMQRLVERPWLDHVSSWMMCATAPNGNMPYYGREYARAVSMVGLRLMVEATPQEKETLLIHFVQLGIDLYGLTKTGAKWQMGGGITSGRKWPVVFAGVLLDDKDMQNFPGDSVFHEDLQTYYGQSWTGQTVLWQMGVHHGIAWPFEEKHPSQYNHQDKRSAGYRVCCNATAWVGEALGALLIGAKQIWNHDAFFDYCDRWMAEQPTPYRQADAPTAFMTKAVDPFVDNMYRAYRDTIGEQPGATNNMKWVWDDGGKWVKETNKP